MGSVLRINDKKCARYYECALHIVGTKKCRFLGVGGGLMRDYSVVHFPAADY